MSLEATIISLRNATPIRIEKSENSARATCEARGEGVGA